MDEGKIHDAAEAYERERKLWTVRRNKLRPGAQWEVVRIAPGDVPRVFIVAITPATAEYELEEQRRFAAMKAALQCAGLCT